MGWDTITRAKLKQGIRFEDIGYVGWKDSWHENDSWAFNNGKIKTCDDCNGDIQIGELYSIGHRDVYPDAPVPVEGIDTVHWKCYFAGSAKYNNMECTIENCLKDYSLKVVELAGFDGLSEEKKREYTTMTGEVLSEEILNKKLCLEGFGCIICGEFDESKESLQQWIEANGGRVFTAVSGSVRYVVLGADGTTGYGQKTGKGSKKYKDAVKKKCKVVTMDYLRDLVKEGKSIADEEASTPKKTPAKKAPAKKKRDEDETEEEPVKKKAKT
jgi:hypothetical protein